VANSIERLVVDCSVIVKWKIPTEDDAAAAEQLLFSDSFFDLSQDVLAWLSKPSR
jgi:hypothetical protein